MKGIMESLLHEVAAGEVLDVVEWSDESLGLRWIWEVCGVEVFHEASCEEWKCLGGLDSRGLTGMGLLKGSALGWGKWRHNVPYYGEISYCSTCDHKYSGFRIWDAACARPGGRVRRGAASDGSSCHVAGANFYLPTKTAMPACPRFPPEISDYIVDILQDADERETLKECCLVSKSWVPRARKHLFAAIQFPGLGYCMTWQEMFPDPTSSPACYTRSLSFGSMLDIGNVVEEGGWIQQFRNVVRLDLHHGTKNLYFRFPQQLLTGERISPRS